jgi:hypothetical protein
VRVTKTMLDQGKLAKLRFSMSEVPKVGGQPGIYQEKWTQWFLERSFFRDFVYRNPRGVRKGEELADAVVLFDDVLIMAQVKAQHGKHEARAWATEKLLEALKQISKTHSNLVGGHIKSLSNDYFGSLPFDPKHYPNRIGLIILAHDSAPYDATKLVPETLSAGFPIHVFSLKDFEMIASRFDTAGDLITFLELRADIAKSEAFLVQDEDGNIKRMLPHVPRVLRAHMSPTTEDIFEKTVDSFEQIATGKLLESEDWKYGLVIDDMIARVHDIDPDLPWNKRGKSPNKSIYVARFLGWLTRERRIKLGKRIISKCELARDGQPHYFTHVQLSRGTTCVYLATSEDRPSRIKTLRFLVAYAYLKYGTKQCVGVATEAIGKGRSYDFFAPQSPPTKLQLEKLRSIEDPFGSTDPL